MNITFEEMERISRIQISLFREFDRVCNLLGLKYVLIHGSLLGAVLYNDCFPGDDDIDIGMPRDDYDIFCKKGKELINKEYFLQTDQTDIEFPLSMAKLRATSTTYIQENMKKLKINHGVYIDIFPIDKYIDNAMIRNIKYIKLRMLNFSINRNLITERKDIFYVICRLISIAIYPSIKTAKRKREKLLTTGESRDYLTIYGSKRTDLKIPNSYLFPTKKIRFSNMEASIPFQYAKYLSLIYGDYEHYSPVKEHIVDGKMISTNACMIDTTRGFNEYL